MLGCSRLFTVTKDVACAAAQYYSQHLPLDAGKIVALTCMQSLRHDAHSMSPRLYIMVPIAAFGRRIDTAIFWAHVG